MAAILALHEVNGLYGHVQVLRHINMSIEHSTITAVLGANGAGKTTLFRTISGMIDVEGKIVFEGRDIAGMDTDKIARLGLGHVPERRGTFAELTVHENLSLGSKSKADRDRVLGYFPALTKLLEKKAGFLSGGEQQMLAIGRALMCRPRVLLLDEPSLGLGPKIVKEIFQILWALKEQEKLTIVVNEQNASHALAIASQVCVLETGRIAAIGTPKAMQEQGTLLKAYLGT